MVPFAQALISRALISRSTDDCIAIKSGKDLDGRAVGIPSSNLLIERCTFGPGHGVSIGRFEGQRSGAALPGLRCLCVSHARNSEMSGNVTNVRRRSHATVCGNCRHRARARWSLSGTPRWSADRPGRDRRISLTVSFCLRVVTRPFRVVVRFYLS